LGDEGRQRGTTRGTEIALPAGKGSVRRPACLKQGGEMNSVVAAQGVPLGQVACRSVCPARPRASPSGRDSRLAMRAWAVDAAALRAERRTISSTSTRVNSSRWAVFTAQQVNPV